MQVAAGTEFHDDPDEVQTARRDVESVLRRLDIRHEDLTLIANGRHIVFLSRLSAQTSTPIRFAHLARTSTILRVADVHALVSATEETAFLRALSPDAPVSRPLHINPLTAGSSAVGLWTWVDGGHDRLSPREWGAALRQIHRPPVRQAVRPVQLLRPVAADHRRWTKAALDPRHPLFGQRRLLQSFADRIEESNRIIADRIERQPAVPLHGDWHPGNARTNQNGEIIAFDFEAAGMGPLEVDFSFVLLGERRFGWSPKIYDEFARGYGHTPRRADVEPFVRYRELSSMSYLISNALQDAEHLTEFKKRLPFVISERAHTATWTWAGHESMMAVEHVFRSGAERNLSLVQSDSPSAPMRHVARGPVSLA